MSIKNADMTKQAQFFIGVCVNCREYGFPHTEKSYDHSIDQDKKVLENEGVKLMWDFSIQTEARIGKKERKR